MYFEAGSPHTTESCTPYLGLTTAFVGNILYVVVPWYVAGCSEHETCTESFDELSSGEKTILVDVNPIK